MPIKKDDTGKRWVEMEFITPGTPEQVWQAMATGPGNAAWFAKATIDERVGGTLRFDLGPGVSSSGEVTAWDPPRRFGYVERDWSPGAPPLATEITITGRSGDRCVVRMVHSLFSSSDEWDDQMEGFESAWPLFFEVLRIYLAHFPGRKGAAFQAMVNVEGDPLAIWKHLMDALNLAGANAGEHRATSAGPEPLSGVIERTLQDAKHRVIMMRIEVPGPGIAMVAMFDAGGQLNASTSFYFYGDHAETLAAASEPKWQDWLGETVTVQRA